MYARAAASVIRPRIYRLLFVSLLLYDIAAAPLHCSPTTDNTGKTFGYPTPAVLHTTAGNTWKCGELRLYFSPSAGGLKKKKKKLLYLDIHVALLCMSTT